LIKKRKIKLNVSFSFQVKIKKKWKNGLAVSGFFFPLLIIPKNQTVKTFLGPGRSEGLIKSHPPMKGNIE